MSHFAWDGVVALALALFGQAEIWLADIPTSRAVTVPGFLVMTAILVWRRVTPLLVMAIVGAALALQTALGLELDQPLTPMISLILATYSVAAHSSVVRASVGGTVALASGFTSVVNEGEGSPANFAFAAVVTLLPWVAGRAMNARLSHASRLQKHAAQLERDREKDTRAARADERARIARELHDILAHNVSVIALQAGAAERVLDADPERVREALGTIQNISRGALLELRRLLGLLRAGDDEVGLAPQPGTGDLTKLVQRAEQVGIAATFKIEGIEASLPPAVALTVFRIAQEALTNVIKHAGASRVDVALRYENEHVEVEVVDDGRGGSPTQLGHGFVGMQERVQLFGGELDIGPCAGEKGFRVKARLPVSAGSG